MTTTPDLSALSDRVLVSTLTPEFRAALERLYAERGRAGVLECVGRAVADARRRHPGSDGALVLLAVEGWLEGRAA